MHIKQGSIVVTGDICVNTLQWVTTPRNEQGLNWQTRQSFFSVTKPAESLLLAKLVELATGSPVRAPKMQELEKLPPDTYLRSTTEVALFPATTKPGDTRRVFRIKRFLGFTGPGTNTPHLLPIINDDEKAKLVIIDDEHNGFNMQPAFWPLALTTTGNLPLIIYKMNNPVESSTLWKHLEQNHLMNTIVVMNGDDFREKGVNVSRSLSWERTARDFVWQLKHNPNLQFIKKCNHLIVTFGLEGVIYYQNRGSTAKSFLYYLPFEFEGDSFPDSLGKMYGLTSCFVAALARRIVLDQLSDDSLTDSIGEGIREGIVAAHKYFLNGFGRDVEASAFPSPTLFFSTPHDPLLKGHVQDVPIPEMKGEGCYTCWYILKDKSSVNLEGIAYDIIYNGEDKVLQYMPMARFGQLKTVDRTEIESYRSIKNLMWEYILTAKTERPLSIAIFGTPGSGKSFGVSEVAASIAPDLISKLNFNLSQFRSLADLGNAFHRIRDLCLEGKVPLVFFDEFDSTFEYKLGWLKYFLAPMQDGVFREGDAVHPIGKAIFVFVGGTSSTFQEFCEDDTGAGLNKVFTQEFKGAKGPDFISRLRGYVNILGPNQTNAVRDQLYIIRRAMLLRALLERKAPHLINKKGEAQIDTGVLRALLKVPRYKHESRSMEAILEMSMLNQAKKWGQSHLPSQEQLKLHVDEEQFLSLLMHDALYSEKTDSIACALYEESKLCLQVTGPWSDLDGQTQVLFRDIAKQIPNSLLLIHYGVTSVKKQCPAVEFTKQEAYVLARNIHGFWCQARVKEGWSFGRKYDHNQKTDPVVLPWSKLPESIKEQFVKLVCVWPAILANDNFKVERENYLCPCETQILECSC